MIAPRCCVPLATAAILFAVLAGCAPRVESLPVDDNKIEIALDKLLAEDSAKLWTGVTTAVYRGRVLLLGAVETAEAKARAGTMGATPEGVIEVINDIQVTDAGGPGAASGESPDDLAIEKSIQAAYLIASDIDPANFRLRSVNGTVYLIGLVETRAELDRVLAFAYATEDVVEVINYIQVNEPAESCGCKKPPAPRQKPKP